MAKVKPMRIIDEAALGPDATRFDATVAPVLNGGDPNGSDHACGSCGLVLLEHMNPAATFHNVNIKCPRCGLYNIPR